MSFSEVLVSEENVELLRLCTAGSVDDGKSTLIGRLLYDTGAIFDDHLVSVTHQSKLKGDTLELSYFTDGLKAEREQGITIDVAYRHFRTNKRRFIIADTPGHEEYTRNMATGASTADIAMLLVDAQKQLLTQSKRHGFIASLFGIKHVLVVINKMDLANYDQNTFDEIVEQYKDFAATLGVPDLAFIPVSALCGDNITTHSPNMPWYQGPTLISYLESVDIIASRNLIDFRLPIQYVTRPNQDFRGYCGQISSGVVRVGEMVTILPSGMQSKIRRIISYKQDIEHAHAHQSVTICLEDCLDASRGDMIVHVANQPVIERDIEVMLIWFDNQPALQNQSYLFKQTSRWVKGEIRKIYYRINPDTLRREDTTLLRLNDIGRAYLSLHDPIYCDEYSKCKLTGSLIVVDPLSNITVGAAIVVRRKEKSPKTIPHDPAESSDISDRVGIKERARRLWNYKPSTIWLTGLSGSGKTTIATEFQRRLYCQGRPCIILDGDDVRSGINKDLAFSPEDRSENIRRVAEIAKILNDNGIIVVVALISPYIRDRDNARNIIGNDNFMEIFLRANFETCQKRDTKGLYKKAMNGQIVNFTGYDSAYESPLAPALMLDTERNSCATNVDILMLSLLNRSVLHE